MQADDYAASVPWTQRKHWVRDGKGGIVLLASFAANTGAKDHVNNVSVNFLKSYYKSN